MALKIFWTKTAQTDRQNIYEFWNERTHSRDYSNKLNSLIHNRIKITQEFPDAGLQTEFNDIKYHLIDDHFKLFYKISENTVYILRFWDVRQDPSYLRFDD